MRLDVGTFSDYAQLARFERSLPNIPSVVDLHVTKFEHGRASFELRLEQADKRFRRGSDRESAGRCSRLTRETRSRLTGAWPRARTFRSSKELRRTIRGRPTPRGASLPSSARRLGFVPLELKGRVLRVACVDPRRREAITHALNGIRGFSVAFSLTHPGEPRRERTSCSSSRSER
jgi:hypothetical protein